MKNRLLCAVAILLGAAVILKCIEHNDEIQKTLDYFENGQRNFQVDRELLDVVMVIGNTGAGKSTLVRFVAGNLTDMRAVPVANVFVIGHSREGIIGNSTTRSQTIYPELVVSETNVAFYDCPGFADTRNISIEITAAFFTKKVVMQRT